MRLAALRLCLGLQLLEHLGFGLVAPADRAGDHERNVDRRQHVGVEQPSDVFLRFERPVEQQIILQVQAIGAAQLLGDQIVRPLGQLAWEFDRLIGVGHAVLLDSEELDDVAFRILRDGHDVVGLGRDLAQQTIGLPLVVERGVWQTQRHEIVNRIDVARSLGT